ncbi:MAG: hypothetical protein IJT70_06585 [Clostridia bacterium]|nr:hypothetical protein [Clostridia bacterium]
METKVCCFIGHRTIDETEVLVEGLSTLIEDLITCENTYTFLFGSRGRFNRLCYELVTKLKEKYPHVKRVYVRAEYPYISDSYKAMLLGEYEDTYFPEKVIGAGKAAYAERNEELVRNADICIIYYRESLVPSNCRSGTKIALEYAQKQKKRIIMI